MTPERERDIAAILDVICAQQLVLDGRISALFLVVEALADKQGGTWDGISFRELIEREKRERILEALVKLEKESGPEHAVRIKSHIKMMNIDLGGA